MTFVKKNEWTDRLGYKHLEIKLFGFKIASVIVDRLFWPKIFRPQLPETVGEPYSVKFQEPSDKESRKIYKFITESEEYQILLKYWKWQMLATEYNFMRDEEAHLERLKGVLEGLNLAVTLIRQVAFFQEEKKLYGSDDESDLGSMADSYRNMSRMDREFPR